jgi:hypothetical protein
MLKRYGSECREESSRSLTIGVNEVSNSGTLTPHYTSHRLVVEYVGKKSWSETEGKQRGRRGFEVYDRDRQRLALVTELPAIDKTEILPNPPVSSGHRLI